MDGVGSFGLHLWRAFTACFISFVIAIVNRKAPIPKLSAHAMNWNMYKSVMYSRMIAIKYPKGFFQSNGNLEAFSNWNRLLINKFGPFLTKMDISIRKHRLENPWQNIDNSSEWNLTTLCRKIEFLLQKRQWFYMPIQFWNLFLYKLFEQN